MKISVPNVYIRGLFLRLKMITALDRCLALVHRFQAELYHIPASSLFSSFPLSVTSLCHCSEDVA